jgi:hypothetical protein
VSDQAIIYWHQKGAKPNGKQHFLKMTEAMVKVSSRLHSNVGKEADWGSSSRSRTRTRSRSSSGAV